MTIKYTQFSCTASSLSRDWQFIAKQASAPHMLRIVPHTVPRVGRSYEHFPDGFELHLLPSLSTLPRKWVYGWGVRGTGLPHWLQGYLAYRATCNHKPKSLHQARRGKPALRVWRSGLWLQGYLAHKRSGVAGLTSLWLQGYLAHKKTHSPLPGTTWPASRSSLCTRPKSDLGQT